MTIKRTISRAFVTATVPVAMIIGGASPALAGDDEKNHNDWVCHEFNGNGHYDGWKKWKDDHCDDDNDDDKDHKNGHHGKNADHDDRDDDKKKHDNRDDDKKKDREHHQKH